MALFLDSASVEETQRVVELGFVWGATTNPALMTQTGRDPVDVITDLCELLPGTVFYQLSAPTMSKREAEALLMVDIDPAKVGLSVPCTTENLGLVASLTDEGITCGVTAVFSPNQAYLACEAGAHFILPYVNCSTRLQGDGPGLVSAILAGSRQPTPPPRFWRQISRRRPRSPRPCWPAHITCRCPST